MKIFLFPLYWFMGVAMAAIISGSIAALINAIASILHSFACAANLRRAVVFGLLCLLGLNLFWASLFVAGWIGDRTNYYGQIAIPVGLILPGIITLAFIPAMVTLRPNRGTGNP